MYDVLHLQDLHKQELKRLSRDAAAGRRKLQNEAARFDRSLESLKNIQAIRPPRPTMMQMVTRGLTAVVHVVL